MHKTTSYIIGWIITLVWSGALIAGIYTGNYQGVITVTPIMIIFATFLFGDKVVFNRRNGNGS